MILNEYQINILQVNGELMSDQSESLIYIEKNILQQTSGEGVLFRLEKNIKAIGNGALISLEKNIVSVASVPTSFFGRNQWEPIITLDGLNVPVDIVTGRVLVIKQEEDHHTAEFTIILKPNTYSLYTFQGKRVIISVRTWTGPNTSTTRVVFTGVVDIPVVNVLEEKLTLNCVADRRSLLANLSGMESSIGSYSETVLGVGNDTYERISARLTTVAASLDFDSSNNATLNSWTPKASPDFSYGSSAVYRKNPSIRIESAAKITNKVNISMSYAYQRCYQAEHAYFWLHPYAPTNLTTGEGGICPFLIDRPTMPTREMIRSAASGLGGGIGDIYYGAQFKSGSYQCSGQWVQWSTKETSSFTAPITDSNGVAVKDASGNQLYRSVTTVTADNTNLYTTYASWDYYIRFSRNVRETSNLTVTAPNSVTTYGVLTNSESYDYTSTRQYTQWETDNSYTTYPSGVTLNLSNQTNSYYFDGDLDRGSFNSAIVCAVNKAKTAILKSHRDTTISFQRPITPTMELQHTVQLTGKWMRGKGKCKRIEHHMCVSDSDSGVGGEAYTAVDLAQYRGVGSVAETAITAPIKPADTVTFFEGSVGLETHLGEDPSGPGSELWNGYVGNIAIVEAGPQVGVFAGTNHTRTYFQESFIVTSPAVPDSFRSNKELSTSKTFNVDIPTDITIYESYG